LDIINILKKTKNHFKNKIKLESTIENIDLDNKLKKHKEKIEIFIDKLKH
jgi:hypothetical protein